MSSSLLSDSDLYRLGDYPSRSVNLINYFLFIAIYLLKSSNSSIKQIIGLYNLDGFPQNWFVASHTESAPVVEVMNICIQPFAVISLLLLYFCRSLIVLQDDFYRWSLLLIPTADFYCWSLPLISIADPNRAKVGSCWYKIRNFPTIVYQNIDLGRATQNCHYLMQSAGYNIDLLIELQYRVEISIFGDW